MVRLLFIDDDEQAQTVLKMTLPPVFKVISSFRGMHGLELARTEDPDLVLLDIDLPDINGIEILRQIKAMPDSPPVIMLTGFDNARLAVEALQGGAVHYVVKPYELQKLKTLMLRNARKSINKKETETQYPALAGFVGESPLVMKLKRLISLFARSDAPVLITGDTGTGKELVARIVHALSRRAHGPFVSRNCGAIPQTLVESELFGSERGAFTDAVSRIGSFEAAHGGSLFLDEIGELSQASQVKLLRALEEKTVSRLGSNAVRKTDTRIICATNMRLEQSVAEGLFRADLYYRISTLPIRLPPLKERIEDVPLIAAHILQKGPPAQILSDAAIEKLKRHRWPGNVRELKNVLERAAIFAEGCEILPENIIFNEMP